MADATLINGLGRYAGGPPSSPLSVITVQKGKRYATHSLSCESCSTRCLPSYRMRLVSMSCDPSYNFTIDGHDMTIIEADGVNTQPLTVDKIEIFAAQRYSFIVRLYVLAAHDIILTFFLAECQPKGRQLLDSCSTQRPVEIGWVRKRHQFCHPALCWRPKHRADDTANAQS